MNKGFTVVELLVVIAIIGILSLVIIPSYKNAKDQLALERSAIQLAQYIAKAREMTISTQECVPCGNIFPSGGYGIYIKRTPVVPPQRTYILFADMNDDQKYVATQDVLIEEISLESKIRILSLSRNHLHIGFKPPDPIVIFFGKTNDPDPIIEISSSSVFITISLDDLTKQKTITVNKVGLITID